MGNKYMRKPEYVEAVQWWKHGDHPEVTNYPYEPDGVNPGGCSHCSSHFTDHGIIRKNLIVCPGNWIIKDERGEFHSCDAEFFKDNFIKVGDPEMDPLTREGLKNAAKPLVDILYKHFNPQCSIIVTQTSVEVVSGEMVVQIEPRD